MLNLFELEPEKVYGLAANAVDKEKKIKQRVESDMYVASLKKDGQYHRYVNMNGEIKFQTRGKSVKTGTFLEIQDKVPHLMNYLNKAVPKNSLIIGELYRPGWTTNEVGSILRCLAPKAIERQKDTPLIFYIHDIWFYDGEDFMLTSKVDRIKKLKEIQDSWKNNFGEIDTIEFATYVDTVEDIQNLISYAFDNDEEGVVLTLKNATVTPGAKTAWKTLKIKKELQSEADVFLTGAIKAPTKDYTGKDIMNWEFWENEKTGEKLFGKLYQDYLNGATITPVTKPYYKGWFGSLEMAVLNKNNERVAIGWVSGFSDDIKDDFLINPNKYIDRPILVNAMETTADYKLRHPKFIAFRDDLNIEDCTFEKIFGEKGE